MTFKESLAYDLETVFFNTNEFAVLVTLKRGSLSATNIAAIVATRTYEGVEREEFITSVNMVDFDIIKTKYKIRGEQLEPQPGDRIVNDQGEVFRVTPIPGKQCFDLKNAADVYRVHTMQVA